jgi:hypothetical protein
MPRKSFRPGEIIAKRREADVQLGQGKKVGEVVKALGVSKVSSGTSCSTARSSTCCGRHRSCSVRGEALDRERYYPGRLIPPAPEQGQQHLLARIELLQRVALDPGHGPGDEPARLAHLDDGDKRAVPLRGDEGPNSGRCAAAWGTPSVVSGADGSSPSPPVP